jgi:hypothetical protein
MNSWGYLSLRPLFRRIGAVVGVISGGAVPQLTSTLTGFTGLATTVAAGGASNAASVVAINCFSGQAAGNGVAAAFVLGAAGPLISGEWAVSYVGEEVLGSNVNYAFQGLTALTNTAGSFLPLGPGQSAPKTPNFCGIMP